jgi:membrane protease YdiL (CAAX protease family)
MTFDTARMRVISLSLLITGILLPFFFAAPTLDYPLSDAQAQQILSAVLPVFLGYVGAAVAYVFKPRPEPDLATARADPLLSVIVNGAFLAFGIGFVVLLFAFGFSNRASQPPGAGMPFADFSKGVTGLLGLMTASIGAAIVHLFDTGKGK